MPPKKPAMNLDLSQIAVVGGTRTYTMQCQAPLEGTIMNCKSYPGQDVTRCDTLWFLAACGCWSSQGPVEPWQQWIAGKIWYLVVSCRLQVLEQPRVSWKSVAMNTRQDVARCDTFWFSAACSWWSQGPIEYCQQWIHLMLLLLLQNWSSTFGKDIINCKSNQARMSRCDDTLWILVACNCWNQGPVEYWQQWIPGKDFTRCDALCFLAACRC